MQSKPEFDLKVIWPSSTEGVVTMIFNKSLFGKPVEMRTLCHQIVKPNCGTVLALVLAIKRNLSMTTVGLQLLGTIVTD